MGNSEARTIARARRGSTRSNYRQDEYSYGNASLHRRDSQQSNASFVSDVEMAHDEVFAGPMSESIPSSVTGFAHRRPRTDSVTSFTYFQEDDESPEWSEDQAVVDEDDSIYDHFKVSQSRFDHDLEVGRTSPQGRKSSAFSRSSVEDPLLLRRGSTKSEGSDFHHSGRHSQKIYVISEDLTIAIAGFGTRPIGFAIYVLLCVATLGSGYLAMKWLPSWKVRLIGFSNPLRSCDWVVIEVGPPDRHFRSRSSAKGHQNQWGEMTVQNITRTSYGYPLSTVFGPCYSKGSSSDYDEEEDPILSEICFLDYRFVRLCFHPFKDKFILCSSWTDPAWTSVKTMRIGLDIEERNRRELVFDKNLIDIQEKPMSQLLVDEVCLCPLTDHYLLRAAGRQVSSDELVPGDVYEISDPSLTQFPCDSLLLAGDCIVNESMLTGESVPVAKISATNGSLHLLKDSATSMHPELAKHFLFNGTKVIRARRPQDGQDDEAIALAIVIRTGFNTTKGSLVRSMLFPKPSGFKFYRDAFRYISVMACIAALGFTASLVNFMRLRLAWHLIIVRALDLITIVVPPALPATLTIGTNFALSRLKRKDIFCISPQRVNVAGKLDVICFDKTGTLTEDGLDVLGTRVVNSPVMRFSDIFEDAQTLLPGAEYERDPTVDYRVHQAILYTMATCHSLRSVDGELLGDPLDLKMFQFTGWSFEEMVQKTASEDGENSGSASSIARPPVGTDPRLSSTKSSEEVPFELGTLKTFEFVSNLRRASVVVGQSGTTGGDVYVKGAPECMREICNNKGVPSDFEDLLSYYTQRGYRVIACASKHIDSLDWPKVQRMTRRDAESNLTFLGFIVFENKLKDATTDTIDELNDARIRGIMCTGDNILTAISVARECKLIDRSAHCFIPHFFDGDYRDPKARLKWQSVENTLLELDEHTLLPIPASTENDTAYSADPINADNYTLAITGDVFRWIIEYANEEIVKRMLVQGQIFARMSPDEKHELVERLQSIDYCCGFCGDGANDCGALKAADVGISLSEAEASVAAPFTSRVFDISCVPETIR
ncbi:uncharacterized protein KY384_003747 [Bacidia gigantensis]|uniref:uncharacterized protein n=1 Tax=Bacidia gigantensis TaxID=2732470 RepID=UPI001D049FDC|nr:uncharacterized protein KY384_003747 [Bacidia gigantensis]KAG8532110.1 hypothetical protein KY384_003747 [Bacidia gigantensis]